MGLNVLGRGRTTGSDAAYAPQQPNLVVPAIVGNVAIQGVSAVFGANTLRLVRCVVPKTGTLRDIAYPIGGTTAGNVIAAVYDTGEASTAVRTKLWDSGTVAAGTANAWQVVGDPQLAVTAGQQVDIGIIASDATHTGGRYNATNVGYVTLPTSFFPAAGGVNPKLSVSVSPGSFTVPSTVNDVSAVPSSTPIYVIGRIS